MEKVTQPYLGYRIRPRYARLVSKNPANAGHLFRDPNGRPSGVVLSSLYLGPGHHTYIDGKLSYNNVYNIIEIQQCNNVK